MYIVAQKCFGTTNWRTNKMKKYFHFWTDDPYNLLNLLAQIYYEKNIDSNEAYTESTAYDFGDMLYQEEYQLNQEEWVDICKKVVGIGEKAELLEGIAKAACRDAGKYYLCKGK